MNPFSATLVFSPPPDCPQREDGEWYWPDGQIVRMWDYSQLTNKHWIVGYHTLGAQTCETGDVFYREDSARMAWLCNSNYGTYA